MRALSDRSDAVARALRRELDEGTWAAGERMPTERALADRFGVSRTVLRSALDRLEGEGRVARRVGRGTFAGRPGPDPSDALADVAALTRPDEVLEVRLALEPALAALAALRASGEELGRIDHAAERAAAADDPQGYERWDGRLHHEIAVAARNRLFLALYQGVDAVRARTAWRDARARAHDADGADLLAAEHRRVVAAIRARDPAEAQAAMHDHLRTVRRRLLGDAPPPPDPTPPGPSDGPKGTPP